MKTIIIDSTQTVKTADYQPKKRQSGIKVFTLTHKKVLAKKQAAEVKAIGQASKEFFSTVIFYDGYEQPAAYIDPSDILKVKFFPGKTVESILYPASGVWEIYYRTEKGYGIRTITQAMMQFVASKYKNWTDIFTVETDETEEVLASVDIIQDTKSKEAIKVIWETKTTGYTQGQNGNQYNFVLDKYNFFSESPAHIKGIDCKHQRSIIESANQRNRQHHAAS